MVLQIDTMSVDHDPQVHISSSIIDLPISKQQLGTTSEASLHEGFAVSQSSVLESPPSLTHTPTTSASSSDSGKSHPQEQLTGVKSLMDEDDNEPMIVDVTPSRRSETLEDAHHKGTGGDDSLPDSSATCCRPTPIRAGNGGAGPLVSSFFGGVEASEDMEERDPPVERSSPPGVTPSSSDGHFFRPIGGLDYEPKQQHHQWDHMYSNSLCADELFFPSCDFHFSEQLDLMTVRLQSNRDVTGGSHPSTQAKVLAALARV
jgi:hypothetical protein